MVWRRYLKRYFSLIFLYTLVCAGIIILGHQLLLPFAMDHLPGGIAKAAVMCVVLLCILPFFPQLMFSHAPDFAALWMESRFNKLPLLFLMGVRFAIAIGLLMMIPIWFFDNIPYWLLTLMIPVAFIAARSKRLRGSYLTIAAKFIANLNERQLHEAQKSDALLWEDEDLIVNTYRIPPGSPLWNAPWRIWAGAGPSI